MLLLSSIFEGMIEKDLVWDELELNDLLALGRQSLAEAREAEIKRNKAELKQQKMLQKPGFNVLVERYNSHPTKPKVISMSKLSQLADPVIGRMTNVEKRKFQNVLTRKSQVGSSVGSDYGKSKRIVLEEDNEPPPFSYGVNRDRHAQLSLLSRELSGGSKWSMPEIAASRRSLRDDNAGFFMTEAIPEETSLADDEASPVKRKPQAKSRLISNNVNSSKNGFAAMLRNRVHDAKKVKKLTKPLELHQIGRSDDLDEKVKRQELLDAYKQRLAKVKKANQDIAQRNKTMLKKAKDRRATLDSSLSESSTGGGKKKGAYRDPISGRVKKINGSGYGKQVQRFTNQPKPRAVTKPKSNNNNQPSGSDLRDHGGRNEDTDASDASSPKTKFNRKYALARQSSLGVIQEEEQISGTHLSQPKKLSSSSAPHLPRRQKTKAVAATNSSTNQATTSNIQDKAADQSNNHGEESSMPLQRSKRSIRSAEAVQRSRVAAEAAEKEVISTKIVATKEVTTAGNYGMKRNSTKSVSPKKPVLPHLIGTKEESGGAHTASADGGDLLKESAAASSSSVKDMDEETQQAIESNIRELLRVEQNRITEDIAISIQKLQQFEKAVVAGDLYTKPDVNSSLARRAERLGSHLSAAESILKEYESMKELE